MCSKTGQLAALLLIVAVTACGGCGAPPPRHAAGGANASEHYIRKYAEKEVKKKYANKPGTEIEIEELRRDGRNWLTVVTITRDGQRERKTYRVDRQGLVNEEVEKL